MISRTSLAVDRIATLVLLVLLIAAGLLGIWWWTGDSSLPKRTDTSSVSDLVAQSWWPWASGAVGVLLILIGLRWVAAHLSPAKVKQLSLQGSGREGKLRVDASAVASAAAHAFADTLGVRSAKGNVNRDRGQIVAEIDAVLEPEVDLAAVAEQADLVSAQWARVLGRDDLRCSVQLTVAHNARSGDRVR